MLKGMTVDDLIEESRTRLEILGQLTLRRWIGETATQILPNSTFDWSLSRDQLTNGHCLVVGVPCSGVKNFTHQSLLKHLKTRKHRVRFVSTTTTLQPSLICRCVYRSGIMPCKPNRTMIHHRRNFDFDQRSKSRSHHPFLVQKSLVLHHRRGPSMKIPKRCQLCLKRPYHQACRPGQHKTRSQSVWITSVICQATTRVRTLRRTPMISRYS